MLELDFDREKSVVTTGRVRFIFKPVIKLLIEHEEGKEGNKAKHLKFV